MSRLEVLRGRLRAACRRIATTIVVLAAAVNAAAAAPPDVVLQPAPVPIPREYFGLHMSKLLRPHVDGRLSAWPDLDIGSWRLWGAYVVWRDLEPQRDDFRFDRLDAYIRMAEEKHVELVLTLGFTPPWAAARPDESCFWGTPGCASEPANLADWERYVTTVARRYKGRIKAYEIWNEPVFTEDGEPKPGQQAHFTGSARVMVDMAKSAYRAIKREDPDALVLSPSVASRPSRFATFLRAGGVGTFDVVAYHFYAAPPERLVDVMAELKKILIQFGVEKLPIWNTEMGYYFERPEFGTAPDAIRNSAQAVLPERLGAAYVLRALVIGAALDMRRFHWYDWDSEKLPRELPVGLGSDAGRRLNAAGRAYGRAVQWLRGRVIEECRGRKAGLWECRLSQGTQRSMLVWSAGPVVQWSPPKAAFVGELDDKVCFRAVEAADSLAVGPMPWLILLNEGGAAMPSPPCKPNVPR